MRAKTVNKTKLANKTVLLRVDFNVPRQGLQIKDDFKITSSLDFIKFLIEKQVKLVLITHLGKPKPGKSLSATDKRKFSTAIVAKRLAKLLGKKVLFFNEPIGEAKLKTKIAGLKKGQVVMLENIRFYKGETTNDIKLAKDLASLADIYINNAFAVSHRAHASVSAIKKYLPSFAGPLLVDEVIHLNKILKPLRPMIAVMGGAKIETKIGLIKNILKRANHVLIGGALANNFLLARGFKVGRSLVSKEGVALAKKLPKKKLVLPIDFVVKTKDNKTAWRHPKEIKASEMIVDIGPETMKLFGNYIKRAKTLIWNGPMGLYEDEAARYGTLFVARAVASRSSGKAFGVVGGGETIDVLKMTKMEEDIDWVSTGGGASLAYLSGEKLPGLIGLIK